VIFAFSAVMVAVLLRFAVSGPLPPKEMGIIFGIAVLIDALLMRLMLVPILMRAYRRGRLVAARWLDRLLPELRRILMRRRLITAIEQVTGPPNVPAKTARSPGCRCRR
jgi:uncharacterized membrane protein YdfJ with MMPL/SSD domain